MRSGIKKWLARGVIAAGVFILALVLLNLFLWLREAPDFKGELAELVPNTASAYIVLRDFSALAHDFETTELFQALTTDEELLAALFEESDKLQELEKVPAAVRRSAFYGFVDRYFGARAACALVRYDEDRPPAFFVFAKTELGFSERVAELCSKAYPELELITEKHNGVELFLYKKEKSKRSFSFFRYGKTVVLSLRSDDTYYLKQLIDYVEAGAPDNLAAHQPFIDSMERLRQHRGLIAWINNGPFIDDMHAMLKENYEEKMQKASYRLLEKYLREYQQTNLSLTYDSRLELRLELSGAAPADGAALRRIADMELLRMAPGKSIAAAAGNAESVQAALKIMADYVKESYTQSREDKREHYRKKYADKPEKLQDRLEKIDRKDRETRAFVSRLGGALLFQYFTELLGQDYVVALESVQPFLFSPLPLFVASAASRFDEGVDPVERLRRSTLVKDAKKTADTDEGPLLQYRVTKCGPVPLLLWPVYASADERCVYLSTSPDAPMRMLLAEHHSAQSLASHPVFQQASLDLAEDTRMILFINFEQLIENLNHLQEWSLFGDDKLEEFLQEEKATLKLLTLLRAALLRVRDADNRILLELVLPVQ
ncbi:hypothetical protein JXA32_13485 [Candidatus Sumerlaeota bacterium]|nr:hypothetical protein [Candidatus Sumerlaeota bacterium]